MDPVIPTVEITAATQAWNGAKAIEEKLVHPKPLPNIPAGTGEIRLKRVGRIRARRIERRRLKPIPQMDKTMLSLWTVLYDIYRLLILPQMLNSNVCLQLDKINKYSEHSLFKNLFWSGDYWYSMGEQALSGFPIITMITNPGYTDILLGGMPEMGVGYYLAYSYQLCYSTDTAASWPIVSNSERLTEISNEGRVWLRVNTTGLTPVGRMRIITKAANGVVTGEIYAYQTEGPILNLDAFGYPTRVADHFYADRILSTSGTDKVIPPGQYVVTWTGDASFDNNLFGHRSTNGTLQPNRLCLFPNCTKISEDLTSNPKRAVFDITNGSGIKLRIKSVNAADPIRNLTICAQADADTFGASIFRETLIDRLANASGLRFADVMATDNNPATTWASRVPQNYCIQSCVDYWIGGSNPTFRARGIAYEHLCDLANAVYAKRLITVGTEFCVWIQIPHKADDTFVVEMAKFFKARLNANIKVRLEYSQKVWDTTLDQGVYASQQGVNAGTNFPLHDRMAFSSRRHKQVWSLFKQGWDSVGTADSAIRVIRVYGGANDHGSTQQGIAFENLWQDCDEVALSACFQGDSIPYEEEFTVPSTINVNSSYSFGLDGTNFSVVADFDTYFSLNQTQRRTLIAQNLYNLVNNWISQNPSGRYDFVRYLYDQGNQIGLRLFYKLQGTSPGRATFSPGSNISWNIYFCNLNGGYNNDVVKHGVNGWSDASRFELWRSNLTAQQILNYLITDTASNGVALAQVDAHKSMIASQNWIRKPKIIYYDTGSLLKYLWISPSLRNTVSTQLTQLNTLAGMKDFTRSYLDRLTTLSSGGFMNCMYSSWAVDDDRRGLFLPGITEKWQGVLAWIEANPKS